MCSATVSKYPYIKASRFKRQKSAQTKGLKIEKFSALSEPDIYGVIIGLENVIQNKLAEGKIVRFDRFGSLYPSLSSHLSGTEKEVSAQSIKKLKVNYHAGKRILEAMENAPKEKVK